MAAPLVLLYFLNRARKDRRYARSLRERLGFVPGPLERTPAAPLWFHAVSVGEVLAASEVIRRLRAEYPAAPVYVSVTTVAGRALAHDKLRGLAEGLFYAPLDYKSCVKRVLRKIRPAAVVVLETEIWPNLYREAKRSGAALLVVNGRISDQALPRYARLRSLFRAALAFPDRILAQSEGDAERYRRLGAPESTVRTAGNLKYDFQPGAGDVAGVSEFLWETAPGKIWIAASTMPPAVAGDVDEDDAVIDAFRSVARNRTDLLLILVPRRPERFDDAAARLERAGIPYLRRSAIRPGDRIPLPGVLLLDSVGELSRLFAVADAVFMGGTLARRGGHNILEPAFFGKPVIIGPHMENFAEIAAEFRRARAVAEIESAAGLAPAVEQLLGDRALRDELGGKAQQLAESKRGVVGRVVSVILDEYHRSIPEFPGSALLEPLARLWERGVAFDRARKLKSAGKLPVRTVSIGNITTGGAGKTPHTAWLAEQMKTRGLEPAILTRGYRRRSPHTSIVLAAGSPAAPDVTGDEAQVFIRSGAASVGIGSNRYQVGRRLIAAMTPDVVLLDDGFQHWRLRRDLDVVLVDALDPFGEGALLPRGRLREPLEALARAGAFIITRTEAGVRTDAIEHRLRQLNARAPIFRSRVVTRRWLDADTGQPAGAVPHKPGAFCGLANPRSFWRTLAECRVEPAFRWRFGDHHVYRPRELRRLAGRAIENGADSLVTTEKDVANLPVGFSALVEPLRVYFVEIGVEIDRPDELLALCLGP